MSACPEHCIVRPSSESGCESYSLRHGGFFQPAGAITSSTTDPSKQVTSNFRFPNGNAHT